MEAATKGEAEWSDFDNLREVQSREVAQDMII
jgi:hypothetical protein